MSCSSYSICVFKVPCLDFLKDNISSYLNLDTQRLKYIMEHSQQKLVPFNEVRSRSRKKINPKSLCHFKLTSLLLFQRVRGDIHRTPSVLRPAAPLAVLPWDCCSPSHLKGDRPKMGKWIAYSKVPAKGTHYGSFILLAKTLVQCANCSVSSSNPRHSSEAHTPPQCQPPHHFSLTEASCIGPTVFTPAKLLL